MGKLLRIGMSGCLLLAGISVAFGRDCNRGQHKIEGKGPLITENTSMKALSSIRIEAPIAVELVEGRDWEYRITGCRNQLDLIRIDVSCGELRITTTQPNVQFYDDQPVRMTVKAPRTPGSVRVSRMGTLNITRPSDATDFSLKVTGMGKVFIAELSADKLTAEASGMGKVEIEELETDDCFIDMSGMSIFTASGRTGRLEIDVSGMSHLALSGLEASEADCTVSGMSHVEVYTDKLRRTSLSGMSHFTHRGRTE